MQRFAIVGATVVLCLVSFTVRAAGGPLDVDYRALVSRADLDYGTPASRSEEGQPIGNGLMGSLVWTTPSAMHFQINRVDVFGQDSYTTSFPKQDSDYASGCGYVDVNFVSAGEDVLLTTLDAEESACKWGKVDFIKMDAEGGELDIVRGGEAFFTRQSPLVMFERNSAAGENEGAQSAFRARGYMLFKLIGPDGCLLSVGPDNSFDAYDLNVFACKPDQAASLAAAGLLTTPAANFDAARGVGRDLWRRQDFAGSFADIETAVEPPYRRALDAYAVWRDLARPLPERCGALLAAADTLRNLTADTQDLSVLSTAARVVHEAGLRTLSLDCLNRMLGLMRQRPPTLSQPFWPASARYDVLRPGADRNVWFLAATLEAYEERRAYSSQFAGPDTLAALDWLAGTRYASPAMERRRQLIAIRAGRQRERQPSPLLSTASAGHLNPKLWGGFAEPATPDN